MMISVIIPAYNRAGLLPRAVESILRQNWQELEIVVVDDASTDDTAEVVNGFADERVRYVRLEQNSGACTARNVGVQQARGELIAFQDADDEWLPGKLEAQVRQLEETGADVVFCAFERHRAEGEAPSVFPHADVQPGRVTYEQLLFENLASTQCILGRRECFIELPFRADFPRLQDWEMMLRMVQRYDVRYFSDVLVRVYEQADSISRQPAKLVKALEMLLEQHGGAIRKDKRLTVQMCNSLAAARKACGLSTWQPYFREMSLRRRPDVNLLLMMKGVKHLLVH